ncbi:MAG: septation protein IspZ [Pseudomonadota bacterium]
MDKRLLVEFAPGIAFLIGNWLGGIFLGAGLAAVATGLAIALRWRWDRSLPWLAISIFGLTVVMLIAGLIFDDTTFVKVSNTVGSLAFAVIIASGLLMRPNLLKRTLGYKIHMSDAGWVTLHWVWIGISVMRAAANEVIWRNFSDSTWAIYNGVSDFAWIGVMVVATSVIAHKFWNGPEDREAVG